MKIVQVIHDFPPYNMAGSEIYTYNLSKELSKDEEVVVFHRVVDPQREEYEMRYATYEGLDVCTINNTFKYCDSFEKTYKNDIISQKFGCFLEEIRPDIVHFGHVTCLSTSLIEEAKKRHLPVVFTLHDFWLFCQLGQLLKRDTSLCKGPKDSECARCLALDLGVKGDSRKAFKMLKRMVPDFQNRNPLKEIMRKVFQQYTRAFFILQKDARAQIQNRTGHIIKMCSLVDLFISPSNFLLRKFVEFGIPRDKVLHYDNGFNIELFSDFVKVKSERIRFGYIGTFIPSKGVHVLLKAFNSVKDENSEIRIHGKDASYHSGFEDYPHYLRSLGHRSNILWLGEYDNKDIARVLSEIDVLVVPSIWYENSPSTIQEAFMARIPVITSNIGGMAELVQDGVNGLIFQVGQSKDLAKKIQKIIENPRIIEKFSKNIKPITSIEKHVLKIRKIYRSLLYGRNQDLTRYKSSHT